MFATSLIEINKHKTFLVINLQTIFPERILRSEITRELRYTESLLRSLEDHVSGEFYIEGRL